MSFGLHSVMMDPEKSIGICVKGLHKSNGLNYRNGRLSLSLYFCTPMAGVQEIFFNKEENK